MMMEYPWAPFSEVEVLLLFDGDLALAQTRDFFGRQFGTPS
jgi:hypothetical protein